MAICAKCGADSNHLNDAGASEFPNGWIDRVRAGDRFKVSRPVPAAWLEQSSIPPSPSYTLAEFKLLIREWLDSEDGIAGSEELLLDWHLSLLVEWLAKRKRGGGRVGDDMASTYFRYMGHDSNCV